MRTGLCICAIIGQSVFQHHAATIVSVTGPNDTSPTAVSFQQFLSVSWSQTIAYDNASISAKLTALTQGGDGTAYLTTQIGSGTTVANEIARTAFTFPPDGSPSLTLFSGLSLSPGNYFLILATTAGPGYWYGTPSPTITLGQGVTAGSEYFTLSSGNDAAYPPDSSFNRLGSLGSSPGFQFLVQSVAVPEPSTAALVALGFAAAIHQRRRKK